MIVSDNGIELISNVILIFVVMYRVEWYYIVLGKFMQNGFVESFNGWMCDEFFNEIMFCNFVYVKVVIVVWVVDYNIE